MVERMNSVVSQTVRCLLHDIGNPKDWEKTLPTVELVINSLRNQSTGFSPFYLNYGYEIVTPIQLIKGDEEIKTESIGSFVSRVKSDWELARENLKKSVDLQAKYYNKKHRDIEFGVGELVLLSTRNLKMKGIPEKLKKRFVGPSKLKNGLDNRPINSHYLRIGRFIPCFISLYLKVGMLQVFRKKKKFQQMMTSSSKNHTTKSKRSYGGGRSREAGRF